MIPVREVDLKVYRGPRLDTPQDYQWIKKEYGINTMLSLEAGFWESFHWQVNSEVMEAIQVDINPVHLYLSDWSAPTFGQILTSLQFMSDAEMLPIYVHCLHGVDRTGVICAAYRVHYQMWPVEKAIEEMLQMGFHKIPYFYWLPSVRSSLQRLAA